MSSHLNSVTLENESRGLCTGGAYRYRARPFAAFDHVVRAFWIEFELCAVIEVAYPVEG